MTFCSIKKNSAQYFCTISLQFIKSPPFFVCVDHSMQIMMVLFSIQKVKYLKRIFVTFCVNLGLYIFCLFSIELYSEHNNKDCSFFLSISVKKKSLFVLLQIYMKEHNTRSVYCVWVKEKEKSCFNEIKTDDKMIQRLTRTKSYGKRKTLCGCAKIWWHTVDIRWDALHFFFSSTI